VSPAKRHIDKLPCFRPKLSFLGAQIRKLSARAPQTDAHPPHLSPFACQCQRHSRQADAPRRCQFSFGAAAPRRRPDSRRSLLLYQRPLLPRQTRLCPGLRPASRRYARGPRDYRRRWPASQRNIADSRRALQYLRRVGFIVRRKIPPSTRARCPPARRAPRNKLRSRVARQRRHA